MLALTLFFTPVVNRVCGANADTVVHNRQRTALDHFILTRTVSDNWCTCDQESREPDFQEMMLLLRIGGVRDVRVPWWFGTWKSGKRQCEWTESRMMYWTLPVHSIMRDFRKKLGTVLYLVPGTWYSTVLTFTRTTWRPENVVTGSDENTTRFVRFIPSFSGDDSLSRVSRHTWIRRRSPKLLDYSAWSTDRRKTGIPKSAAPLH